MLAKVKDHKEYVRDIETNAILNVDKEVLKKHAIVMAEKEKETRHQEQINNLKSEISELKDMIRSLLDRGI